MADDVRQDVTPETAADGDLHVVRHPIPHDSAARHVTGTAAYIDDMLEPPGLVHVQFGTSEHAHAEITSIDLDAVRAAPGVIAVLTPSDIPGKNDVSPVFGDDPLFADQVVEYVGQPIFGVVAETYQQARRAARLGKIAYAPREAVLTAEAALERELFVLPTHTMKRGDVAAALERAPHRIKGRMAVGGQEHFYLEGQAALAIPGEGPEMTVYSSTQHPTEVQHKTADLLGVASAAITVEVRRMGGGFGGKEAQATMFAAAAALAAHVTGRPAKMRVDRDDDMMITGKRHDFIGDYDVGYDDDGRITAADYMLASRCGRSVDLSLGINDRAMFHIDNCYYLPDVRVVSHRCKTHTQSNTAFRGFGGPQGMVIGERVIEEIAFALGKDPLEVRRANFYGTTDRNVTQYHMPITDNIVDRVVDELVETSDYQARRAAIREANAASPIIKHGLALVPVKFGISFTVTHLNQAGALVLVYTDGSVQVNHGGTEMGQGLYIKVAQVVADVFQVAIDLVQITATTTGKVPNTSPTAASSGSDMNGMAALDAAQQIRDRMTAFAAEAGEVAPQAVRWVPDRITAGDKSWTFAELAHAAYMARVPLSASGFYATPHVYYDRETASGRPFYYFAYGAAVSEVAVDTLTGEYKVTRVDILHDVGKSLNPAVDMGQVEGGFIQGMGWLTTEELWFDDDGRLRTHAPSTYKIPACGDRPAVFNLKLMEGVRAEEPTIHRSKAVGEPPVLLAVSVLHALSDAIASVADHAVCPRLDAPATPEVVLATIDNLRRRAADTPGREAAE